MNSGHELGMSHMASARSGRSARTEIVSGIPTSCRVSAGRAPGSLPGGGLDPAEHLGQVVPQPLPVLDLDLLEAGDLTVVALPQRGRLLAHPVGLDARVVRG